MELPSVRDAPLDIWGGGVGGARVFIFFHLSEKIIFFLAIDVRQFFFMFRRRNEIYFLLFAFPIMYVNIWWLFWSTYFSSISTTNFFFCHIFNKKIFSDFCGDKLFISFFSRPPPPRYQMVRPLCSYCYSGDYTTRGYRSFVKSQCVSALHCIAKPKCTTVWGNFSIVRFTLNSSTRVNKFRGFLSQFWTNFHDILHRQLSSHGPTTLWHVMKLWDEANGFMEGDIYNIFQWKYSQ